MTLREHIGQLFMMGFTGTTVSKDLASFLTAYKPGASSSFVAISNRSSRSSISPTDCRSCRRPRRY